MAQSLIEKLSALSSLTPDEIANKLRPRPWKRMGTREVEELYLQNPTVYLYNTEGNYYWDSEADQPVNFSEAGSRAMHVWGSPVFEQGRNQHWFLAIDHEARPFEVGVDDAD